MKINVSSYYTGATGGIPIHGRAVGHIYPPSGGEIIEKRLTDGYYIVVWKLAGKTYKTPVSVDGMTFEIGRRQPANKKDREIIYDFANLAAQGMPKAAFLKLGFEAW